MWWHFSEQTRELVRWMCDQVSLPCNVLLRTQLLFNFPLIIKDTSLLVSSGTSCLNLFQPIRILASTTASASPSNFALAPLSTLVRRALVTGFKQPLQMNDFATDRGDAAPLSRLVTSYKAG